MAFDELDALFEEDAPPDPAQALRPVVVVVDDDVTMRQSLQVILEDRYRVVLCASAQEGVAAITEDVCVVILDVKMKGYNGFWACSQIRKDHPDLPIIFYSAYQDLKDPYEIINEHRPFGYITKDGSTSKLLEAVDLAVRLHKLTLDNKRLVASLGGSRRRGGGEQAPTGNEGVPRPERKP